MTPDDSSEDGDATTTVRTVLNMLMTIAADLPDGLDTRIEVAICDGENLQLIDQVDVAVYTEATESTAEVTGEPFVILRGHQHPGEHPGVLLRGVASDADAELRKLTGDDPQVGD